jgi:hypothetical protein
VRCADPEAFYSGIARKLRNRVGTVDRHQPFGGAPIVMFPAIGRRKEFKWVVPHPSNLAIEPDDEA